MKNVTITLDEETAGVALGAVAPVDQERARDRRADGARRRAPTGGREVRSAFDVQSADYPARRSPDEEEEQGEEPVLEGCEREGGDAFGDQAVKPSGIRSGSCRS